MRIYKNRLQHRPHGLETRVTDRFAEVQRDSMSASMISARFWLFALLGCCAVWGVAMVLGVIVASLYDRAMYPPEPDPVHFDVGFVFLFAWLFFGLVGSIWFVRRPVRGGCPPAA